MDKIFYRRFALRRVMRGQLIELRTTVLRDISRARAIRAGPFRKALSSLPCGRGECARLDLRLALFHAAPLSLAKCRVRSVRWAIPVELWAAPTQLV